jgi:hypothetical protein
MTQLEREIKRERERRKKRLDNEIKRNKYILESIKCVEYHVIIG